MGSAEAFWRLPIAALFARTGSAMNGLTSAQAADRLAQDGPNTFREHDRTHVLLRIARRLAEPLVAILLIAGAIAALTGDLASFVIILIVIVLSIALDVFQEHRAEAAADALRRSVAVHADV